MGRTLQAVKRKCKQIVTSALGGDSYTLTVPATTSIVTVTGTAAGGVTGTSPTTVNALGTGLFFARMKDKRAALLCTGSGSTNSVFSVTYTGSTTNGSIIRPNGASSIFGATPGATPSCPMSNCYFNPSDVIPWGFIASEDNDVSATLITSTTDGFTYSNWVGTIPDSTSFVFSMAFGGSGEAVVAYGGSSPRIYITSNYGVSWTELTYSAAFGGTYISRIRYINGTWVAMSGSTTFYYTTTPASGAWTSRASGQTIYDMGWTGTTYVAAINSATNAAICSTLTGTWTTQAHGGNQAFRHVESGNGEVALFYTTCTAVSSIRATSGSATSWYSVSPYTGANVDYGIVKYIPFTSGGMWIFASSNNTNFYSRTSLLSGSATSFTVTSAIAGFPHGGASGNGSNCLQWCGGNYVYLGTGNGLGKYSSAGIVTSSLVTTGQLTVEFEFVNTTHSDNLKIYKGTTLILNLEGGYCGSTTSAGGIGGGSLFPMLSTGAGIGPEGQGGISNLTVTSVLDPTKNGGRGSQIGYAGQYACGGGGAPLINNSTLLPSRLKIPGASGGRGTFTTWAGIGGGGGSIYAKGSDGIGTGVNANHTQPLETYIQSAKIGQYGAGATGFLVNSNTSISGAGSGEGVYKYDIPVSPGDVLTFIVPGIKCISCTTSTITTMPGGEGYCEIEWEE